MKDLTDIQVIMLYSALLTAEEDGRHTNRYNARQATILVEKLITELRIRGINPDKPFCEYDPYTEENGFVFH